MGTVGQRVSYADLCRWPDDGRRYELYDGEVWVVPSPLPVHQLAALNIEDMFRTWVREHGGVVLLSPLDIVFSEYDVAQPDVVLFRPERQQLVTWREAIRVPPDVAVEVLSPSTASNDRGRKMRMFARYGVPEYWLVDPELETIEILRLEHGRCALAQKVIRGEVARSVLLANLACPVDEVFRTDLRS